MLKKNNLKSVFQENFKLSDKNISEVINKEVFKKIFSKAEKNKIELLEENDFYLLYEIKKVEKILPSLESINFISNVKEIMFNKSKNDFNYNLIKKISQKSFTQKNFEDISSSSKNGTENILISSISDTQIFTNDSIKHIYSLSKNFKVGIYYIYAFGFDDSSKHTNFLVFNTFFPSIPISNKIDLGIFPNIYYLKMDELEGSYFSSTFRLTKKN